MSRRQIKMTEKLVEKLEIVKEDMASEGMTKLLEGHIVQHMINLASETQLALEFMSKVFEESLDKPGVSPEYVAKTTIKLDEDASSYLSNLSAKLSVTNKKNVPLYKVLEVLCVWYITDQMGIKIDL